MPLNIISNFAANVAHRNLTMSDSAATSSLAKLSAGTRVLSAKDDAASLAIGSRLNAEITGLKQAAVNAGQAVSMLQIADGAMNQVNDILTRMKSLSVQAGSGQLATAERTKLDSEFQALVSEIDRISIDTEFAGTLLVNGGYAQTRDSAIVDSSGIDNIAFVGVHADATSGALDFGSGNDSFTVGVYDSAGATTSFTGTISSSISDGTSLSTGTVVTLTNANTSDTVELTLTTAFNANASITANNTIDLSGANSTSFTFKVGTGSTATADDITVSVNSISVAALGLTGSVVSDATSADTASQRVSTAIDATYENP